MSRRPGSDPEARCQSQSQKSRIGAKGQSQVTWNEARQEQELSQPWANALSSRQTVAAAGLKSWSAVSSHQSGGVANQAAYHRPAALVRFPRD